MTKAELRDKIFSVLDEDPALLADVIEELDDLKNDLGEDRWWPMSELDNFFNGFKPSKVASMCYYGRDLDNWDENASFNPSRLYFRYTALGNLDSSDIRDYSDYNDEFLADQIATNYGLLDSVKHNEELLDLAIDLDEAED